ncbi:hypothetical protein [Clostridium beijerinckii]|uniref:HEAT repeat domain-containing protein n=1 Tax=Clostridium beijerinckii TaxID=1520 RepID=A0A1S8RX05_CLOBE|nr:hypothetical protein [Clostridium beijerinckii]NRY59423.1 hypothetical protein [Clostridium beijerinckii]OOM57730.1 hypothetical protein CLBCK_41410 [Clostridium beijerinckii]
MVEKIAFNLGRNDEKPNIDLAIELINLKDLEGIKEIVDGLKNRKEQIANDCMKVLYEIGERNPELIAEYVLDFINLLKSRNNRLVWGSMTAISKIVFLKPKEVFRNIEIIISAYENGSVITRDNSISVFAELAKADKEYEKLMLKKILDHLSNCRPKEIGQHAERAFICINQENSKEFISVLLKRRENLSDSQKKRIDKLIKNIEKGNFNS